MERFESHLPYLNENWFSILLDEITGVKTLFDMDGEINLLYHYYSRSIILKNLKDFFCKNDCIGKFRDGIKFKLQPYIKQIFDRQYNLMEDALDEIEESTFRLTASSTTAINAIYYQAPNYGDPEDHFIILISFKLGKNTKEGLRKLLNDNRGIDDSILIKICNQFRLKLSEKKNIRKDSHVYFLFSSINSLTEKNKSIVQDLNKRLLTQNNISLICHEEGSTFPLNFKFRIRANDFISKQLKL